MQPERFLAPVGRLISRVLILPIYRLIVTARLRLHRLSLPTRGFIFFLLTNRYLFHGVIVLLAVVTVLANLQNRQAHAQDVGQQSLLFALATDQQTQIIEETVRPEQTVKNTNYLGSSTLINIPHIDFDYTETAGPETQSLSVPGTIAALPYSTSGNAPVAPRSQTVNYTVQENDTISDIAQRFGLDVGTILWNNDLQGKQYIRPGDVLRIPPTSGILAKVKSGDTIGKLAQRYNGDADEIASFNNLTSDAKLAVGSEIMVPGGRPAEIAQTSSQVVARANAPEQPAPDLSEVITAQPTKKPADADTSELPSTRLLWPTSGHTINQYFSWRHIGIDIDGDYSSPLYAAADGVVEKAEWSNAGYGLMVLIRNSPTMETRYGHSSKLFVKAGDVVKRGQVIAMMGTTGRSTGTHLHFEVVINGKRVNPLGYIR